MQAMGARLLDLLRASPLVDGHNDLLWARREAWDEGRPLDESGPWPELHTDLQRARAGGLGAQFWSVFVPTELKGHEAVTATLEQIDALHTLVAANPDSLELARSAPDVERISASGRIASLIGVEGGHSIGGSLGVLRILARLGAGYMTLTHNDDTDWADSATGKHPHGGLTRFGEEVVRELNTLGVLVDLSHVSDDTMRQAIEISRAPVIFSHSSTRALADVTRNVPDDVLELVGQTGGVVMVTFVPGFLTHEGAAVNALGWQEARRQEDLHPDDPKTVSQIMDEWFKEHDTPADVTDVADHVDHIRDIAGIGSIGIGGDLDGVPTLPKGLEDVSCYPNLFEELASRGYRDEELMAIAGRNVLRVMREAERAVTP
jgi:membrane dipeptidase